MFTIVRASEKRRILNDRLIIGRLALEAYEKIHDEFSYAKTCCNLPLCLIERQYIASDSEEMTNIAEAGVDFADKTRALYHLRVIFLPVAM